MKPRSISEAKRLARPLNAASKAARDVMHADPTNTDKQDAYVSEYRPAFGARQEVWTMKLRRHGVRTRRQRHWDHHYFSTDRAEAGRKATDDRKAARQLRRDAERATRAEREEQARAAEMEQAAERAEVARLKAEWLALTEADPNGEECLDAQTRAYSAMVAYDLKYEAPRRKARALRREARRLAGGGGL